MATGEEDDVIGTRVADGGQGHRGMQLLLGHLCGIVCVWGGGGMGVGVVGRGAPGGEVKERGHDRCGGVGLE